MEPHRIVNDPADDIQTELGEIWGRVSNVADLELCVTTVWERIAEERLDSLIRSISGRLQKIIDAESGAIPY
jgi:hypothetical protein